MITNVVNIIKYFSRNTCSYKTYSLIGVYEDFVGLDPGSITCAVEKAAYREIKRDEHGAVSSVILHEPDRFEFVIASAEFYYEDCSAVEVILRRFKAEVDYHIKSCNKDSDQPLKPNTLRKYHCICCGTSYSSSHNGYTPTCKNCGALMREEIAHAS